MNFIDTNIFEDLSPDARGLYDSTFVMFGVVFSSIMRFVVVASLWALVHAGLYAQDPASSAQRRDSLARSARTARSRDSADTSAPSALPEWTPRVGSANWVPGLLGTQVNYITQHLARSHAAYLGPNSLDPNGDTQTSQAYGIYAGMFVSRRLQGYLDVEMIRGGGINHATGVAGITDGDVLRQGSVDLGSGPYVARGYLKYTVPFDNDTQDTLQRAQDQLPMIVASRRLEIIAGKTAATDYFDLNRYANTTRQQFSNWGLFQNTAWDYAADTRGYSNGIAVSWITPLYTVRVGSFQMPKLANGNKFDSDLLHARGDQIELTVNARATATVIRALAWMNHARMGSYQVALDNAARARTARTADTVPNVVADDQPGRLKYGYGLNVEQPLADSGETGLFARAGWSDGANESFVFTEADRHLSIGLQLSGAHWGRTADRFAIAGVQHGIVDVHQRYLAAGGVGFLLGDGALTYGPEQVLESYYRAQLGQFVQIGPDIQVIRNPGYNRDHSTVTVLGFRVNGRY